MNIVTGDIRDNLTPEEIIALSKLSKESKKPLLVEIELKEMTSKQKKEKKVSLHDNKSVLGKKLVEKRKEAGLSKSKERNKRRNLQKKINKL